MSRILEYLICTGLSMLLLYMARAHGLTVQETVICVSANVSFIIMGTGDRIAAAIKKGEGK